MSVTEFTDLNPTEFHLVPEGATGFPVLLAKAAADELDDVAWEDAHKALGWGDAHKALDAEIGETLDSHAVKFVSAADRRKYAKSGVAMPNGDFPIPNEGHLRSAIGRLAQYKGDKGAAKAHIIKRAKAMGLTHLLPEDWHVKKQTAPDKSVPRGEAESQTHEVDGYHGDGNDTRPDDGGEPRDVSFPHGPKGDGQGDTAPDETVPRGEAVGQTHALGKAGEGDGTGDKAPDGDEQAAHAKDEAEGQTRDMEKAKGAADKDPGSPEWEHKDVALGEKAEALVSQLADVVHTFTQREKAEGNGHAAKAGRRLSAKTEGAIRRCMQALQDLLENTHQPASKEIAEMDANELIKLLDERDAARRADQDKQAKKQAKKAAKDGAKDAKKTAKAAKGTSEAAEGAVASKAAEGTGEAEVLRKQIDELNGRLVKMESEPANRPFLNGAGVTAALRGPGAQDVFKAHADRIAEAQDALAKAKGTPRERMAIEDLRTAEFQLAAAKMVANENARERNPGLRASHYGPNSVQLFDRVGTLPDDARLHGV